MDRIQRRQISSCPFLRPAQFFAYHIFHSDSVRFGGGERGKRHEFINGEIHGTATRNLFFLLHGSGAISNFIISCFYRSWYLLERGSNRIELDWRVQHRRWTKKYVDSPVDAKLEIGWSSLAGDLLLVIRGFFVWQQWTPDSFHGLVVGGGHCGLTLRILFFILFLIREWSSEWSSTERKMNF